MTKFNLKTIIKGRIQGELRRVLRWVGLFMIIGGIYWRMQGGFGGGAVAILGAGLFLAGIIWR